MADITVEVGTQLSFAAHAGSAFAPFSGSNLEIGTPTQYELNAASVADDAAVEGAKFDLGANRAPRYSIMSTMGWGSAPTTGERVDYYVGWSPTSSAALGNPGGLIGSSSGYIGGPNLTLDEGLAQLDFVGSMVVGAYAGNQTSTIGTMVPKERYGTLVIVNRSGQALTGSLADAHTVMTPIVDDVATS